jgi:hypothetical protein
MSGKLFVGRMVYDHGKLVKTPSLPGFKSIKVMMKSHSDWWPLSPYYLEDEKGRILENKWQFSKIYSDVPSVMQTYSRYNKQVIWQHPKEIHVTKDGILTKEYWAWRRKGMECPYAIRYPVGYYHRHKCLGALKSGYPQILDYIESRKQIYLPEYVNAVRKEPLFNRLVEMLRNGENLLILEVDGPHQESLSYYKEKYGTSNFIRDHCMEAKREYLQFMLEEPKHPFGHGYCLCIALLDEIE